MKRWSGVAIVSVGLMTACGQDGYGDVIAGADSLVVEVCRCREASEGLDYDTCVESSGDFRVSAATRDCQQGVYDENREALDPTYECSAQVFREATDCYATMGCDAAASATCSAIVQGGSDRCPPPPGPLLSMLAACVE